MGEGDDRATSDNVIKYDNMKYNAFLPVMRQHCSHQFQCQNAGMSPPTISAAIPRQSYRHKISKAKDHYHKQKINIRIC